ncbi:DUF3375 domain-containing protein [Helcobacillus massiliensis]
MPGPIDTLGRVKHQGAPGAQRLTAGERKSAYEKLRRMSTWRLLSAHKAPAVLAILQSVFPAGDRRLERSEMVARVNTHLGLLHDDDEQRTTAGDYVDSWVREGYLTRRDDPHSVETTFEPSPATVDAVQFIASLEEHNPTTTESRLTLVLQQFERLAQETETDRDVRLRDLQQRREDIEREIRELSEGELMLPSQDTSVDRLKDILLIADRLSGDFLQYREDLRAVDLHLREQILSPEGSRGEILEQLLAGDDLLGQSTVGRTFTAFFRLLNDPRQNEQAQDVVDRLLSREFAKKLTRAEREKLANVFSDLYEPAQEVLDVKTELYRSLARFVRSQDFRQHRVLLDLLQEAQGIALAQKDEVPPKSPFPMELDLTRIQVTSVAQHVLKDPSDPGLPAEAVVHDATMLSPEALEDLVQINDIDLAGLTARVNDTVAARGQATVGSLVRDGAATQGLASVVGLMLLATQYASKREGDAELIQWVEPGDVPYAAKIPAFYFLEALPDA